MPETFLVSDLTRYIRALFDSDLQMQDVWVQGEVSNFTAARSGHWYFTLKDASAALKCVMWRSDALRQLHPPRDGDSILAHGRVSIYDAGGQYQLYADLLQPIGVGDLHAQFEALKAKLDAEGLFDPERKRPLPLLPQRIGVVTSPTAAAFQDVQNVLRRRYPLAEVILSPTLVQGAEAPPQIVAALRRLNDYTNVDVILLVRGGGSLEDLWAFNDERVARAVYASRVPVVSGVGHEVDFTIADFVADVRAPTPSAAAELATPDMADLVHTVRLYRERLDAAMQDVLITLRRRVQGEARALRGLSPQRAIGDARQRTDDLLRRAGTVFRHRLDLYRLRLQARRDALTAADPRAVLARGYAIVETPEGRRLTRAGAAHGGDRLRLRFLDGNLSATVEDTTDA